MPGKIVRSGPMALIRLMVGSVFLSEGIQKFLYPDALGAGRFAKIGIPAPGIMGPFVGTVETAIALLIDISVAILSTKIPILLGRGFGPFSLPKLPSYGLWSFLHEGRTDWCMFLGCLAVILAYARPGASGSAKA